MIEEIHNHVHINFEYTLVTNGMISYTYRNETKIFKTLYVMLIKYNSVIY